MKKHLMLFAALILLVSLTHAAEPVDKEHPASGEAACPAHQAAQLGHDPFDAFHSIMAPAWHNAWPEKDYDALLAVGPEFQKSFEAIAKLDPSFKTEARKKQFQQARGTFAELVESYAAAAKSSDKEKVYEIMPKLHDAFEMTASTLLPVSYPEMEGVAITMKLILETHLPEDNMDGIVGSTETLLSRFDILTDTTTVPDELKEKQTEIMAEIAVMKKLALQMQQCCDKKDMKGYSDHATTMDKKVKEFFEKYI